MNLIRRVDENWFEGRVGSQKGIFPVSYVEVLLEPSERPGKRGGRARCPFPLERALERLRTSR